MLAVIGIIYGALLAIGQTDMMRLIAYTSLSHFGFITLGIFAFTTQGQSGSTLYMVNHGFSTAGLFLVAGFLVSSRGSRQIADYGGVQRVAPLLAGVVPRDGPRQPRAARAVDASSASSSCWSAPTPATRWPPWSRRSASSWRRFYVLCWYQRVATGPATDGVKGFRDLGPRARSRSCRSSRSSWPLGFFPKPVLDVINPAVDHTLQQVGTTDPPPTAGDGNAAEGTSP